MKKRVKKIVVNNKLKEYGNFDVKTGVMEINRKKHKGNKTELADTVHHELLHAKHPKAKEKTIQKKTKADISTMSQPEKDKLIAKLRMKKLNYKRGAIKRKLKVTASDKVEPGDLIKKSNDLRKMSPKNRTAFMGLM